VDPFANRLPVTLVRQEPAGPAVARNTGVARARGDCLAFTDDDCRPAPDWLARLADRLDRDPAALVGGLTLNALTDNPYSTASQLLIDYLYSYYNPDAAHARFFTSNNLALSAARFRDSGGFDVTCPRPAGEDREFCDRWQQRGLPMVYAPEARVFHYHLLSLPAFARQHFTYGRGAYYFRLTRARRGGGRVDLEPAAFYTNLIRYPFRRRPRLPATGLAALLTLAQAANACGYFWEKGVGRHG
jgi:GT2 family glycosyltransferase